MKLLVIAMSVCLNFSIGCAAKQPANLQNSERLHWRTDVHAWEMTKVGFEATLADCKVTLSPSDDAVQPSDVEGMVLVTDGLLDKIMVTCATNKAPHK